MFQRLSILKHVNPLNRCLLRCLGGVGILLVIGPVLRAVFQANAAEEPPRDVDAVTLEPSVLAAVRDRTRGIRDEEREAYYRTLQYAQDTDHSQQRRDARRNVAEKRGAFEKRQQRLQAAKKGYRPLRFSLFADILKRPAEYRGGLVSFRGHVYTLEDFPAGENDQGFETLYQTGVFTDDSQSHPYVVVCGSIPEGMPTGGNINEDVLVTGYFFKLYGYTAQDVPRIAPLIIASKIEWRPRQPSRPLANPLIAGISVTVVLVLITLVIWRMRAKDRRALRLRRARFSGEEPDFGYLSPDTGDSGGRHEPDDSSD